MISGKIGNGNNAWCDGFARNRPRWRAWDAKNVTFNLEKGGLSGFHSVVVGGVKLQAAGPTRRGVPLVPLVPLAVLYWPRPPGGHEPYLAGTTHSQTPLLAHLHSLSLPVLPDHLLLHLQRAI
jgi:hypothetical protein